MADALTLGRGLNRLHFRQTFHIIKLIPFSVFTLQLATVLGPTSYQLYNFRNATSEHCLQQTMVSSKIGSCVQGHHRVVHDNVHHEYW